MTLRRDFGSSRLPRLSRPSPSLGFLRPGFGGRPTCCHCLRWLGAVGGLGLRRAARQVRGGAHLNNRSPLVLSLIHI
eukprot:12570405-Alexandrium_andersonii.AAC.1